MQALCILLTLECQSMLLGYEPSQMCRKLQELTARAQVNLTQSHLLKQVSVHEIESRTQYVPEHSLSPLFPYLGNKVAHLYALQCHSKFVLEFLEALWVT